jgi:hypothetical protein
MLTPEKRLRVSSACGFHEWQLDNDLYKDSYYRALTRKCAELIEAMDGDNLGTMMLFNKYLTTSNTSAIEELVSELLEVAGL